MKSQSNHLLFGLFLMLVGGVLMLNTLDILYLDDGLVFGLIFFVAGLVLGFSHFFLKKGLWALILGGIGVFIGLAIYIDESRIVDENYIGIILFFIIAAIFLSALRHGRKNWWAIIPGGISLVLAGHVWLDMDWRVSDEWHGVLFFGGLGLIFTVIWLLKNEEHSLDWAKYPALVGFGFAALVLLASDIDAAIGELILPLLLIIVGGSILYKSLHPKVEKEEVAALPQKDTPDAS